MRYQLSRPSSPLTSVCSVSNSWHCFGLGLRNLFVCSVLLNPSKLRTLLYKPSKISPAPITLKAHTLTVQTFKGRLLASYCSIPPRSYPLCSEPYCLNPQSPAAYCSTLKPRSLTVRTLKAETLTSQFTTVQTQKRSDPKTFRP